MERFRVILISLFPPGKAAVGDAYKLKQPLLVSSTGFDPLLAVCLLIDWPEIDSFHVIRLQIFFSAIIPSPSTTFSCMLTTCVWPLSLSPLSFSSSLRSAETPTPHVPRTEPSRLTCTTSSPRIEQPHPQSSRCLSLLELSPPRCSGSSCAERSEAHF